ncbi:hypothetical protein U4E84_12585 [Halorubrum sp. AD140]|uniref:hypothetical protein n=1 Tax=Halorubrum sp. AD140 TaxID=3050073 RepID=UPI002ACCA512|nr:hypothetical protein [Halorubrum sp. AD140]MDZ5812178.1 hypothetical protein [Halorubrum sp. AD140]
MTTTEALLIGRRRRLALTMVGGFAGVVALAVAAAVIADLADLSTATALTDRLVPLLVFYAPAPIAAVGGYARCGGPALVFAALVVVGTVFGVPGVGPGDDPLGGVTMAFAAVGLSGAFIGYCAGVTVALLADLAGYGNGDDADDVDDRE